MLISYAQNKEDLYLHVLLHDVSKGFYVDVGANYPTTDSVTKFFYDRGWSGINIEPIKELYEQINAERPRDINLNVGAGSKNAKLLLRKYKGSLHGWSTFDESTKASHKNQPYTELEVSVTPLRQIFSDNKVKSIDFLKVDVEGFEYEVLNGNDWDKYRPKVVLIEGKEARCLKFLAEVGYEQVFYDGLNTYFVRNDLTSKHTMDDYIKVLLSGESAMTNKDNATEKQLKLTEKVLRQTKTHLTNLQKSYDQLQESYDQSIYHIQHPESFLGIKVMTVAILRRIIIKIKNLVNN